MTTKEDVYRLLARLYKWTPYEIARMTPYQQMVMIGADEDQAETLKFATAEELADYMARRAKGEAW